MKTYKAPFKLIIRGGGYDGDDAMEIFNSLDEIKGLVGTRQYIVLDADNQTVTSGDLGCFSEYVVGDVEMHNYLNS